MIRPIHNNYNPVLHAGKPKSGRPSSITPEEAPKKGKNCDVVEISMEEEIGIHTSQTDGEEKTSLLDLIAGETQEASEGSEEGTRSSGKVGINSGKLARMLAAAKTRGQLQVVIAKIKQDLSECEAGEAQGMDVDAASVQAAELLLSQAQQRMGQAAGREATPEEEMAFSLAGLM